MLRCVRQLLVRPLGQTEEVRASYAAPSSPAAPGPELPVSLFVPANPQRAADQLQAYGQVTRMPPYASTSLAHSTPRPVAVGGNCYTTRLAKTCKTAVVLFSEYGNFEEVLLSDLVPLPGTSGQGGKRGRSNIPPTPGLPPAFRH